MKKDSSMTYVIPLEPTKAPSPSSRVGFSGVGIALSGVRLDAPAPVKAILDAYTLAPFDDCGGHVNLHVGYHVHAVKGCLKELPSSDNHAAMIGISMDGYPLHSRLNPKGEAPQGLDRCRGHQHGDLAYHYHVAAPGKNAIIPCHTGPIGCVLKQAGQSCDATKSQRH